jgi:hypothetical protein
MSEPISVLTPRDHHTVIAAHLTKLKGTARDGHPVTEPLATIQSQGNHHALTLSTKLVRLNEERAIGRGPDARSDHRPS